jgi:hypothetical protein
LQVGDVVQVNKLGNDVTSIHKMDALQQPCGAKKIQ